AASRRRWLRAAPACPRSGCTWSCRRAPRPARPARRAGRAGSRARPPRARRCRAPDCAAPARAPRSPWWTSRSSPDTVATPARSLAAPVLLRNAKFGLQRALHRRRHQARDVATQPRDVAHEAARDVEVVLAGHHEDRLDLAIELAIHVGHLEL